MCFFLLQNGCLCRFVASFRCWENGRNSKYRKHWNHHSSFFCVNFFSSRRFVAMFLVYEKMEEKDSRKISACMIFVIFLWVPFYFLWRSLFSMEIIALHCIALYFPGFENACELVADLLCFFSSFLHIFGGNWYPYTDILLFCLLGKSRKKKEERGDIGKIEIIISLKWFFLGNNCSYRIVALVGSRETKGEENKGEI